MPDKELVFHLSQVIYEYIIILFLGSDTCKRIEHIIVSAKDLKSIINIQYSIVKNVL
jgi:hypothetical protein